MSRKVVYAKQSAHVAAGDETTRFMLVGESFDAEDPLVKMYPSMFTDDPTPFQRVNSPISGGAPQPNALDGAGESLAAQSKK